VRAIALLEGFEESIKGLPDANRRTTDALLVRVQSRMALGQLGPATDELVQLLDREPTRGGRIVFDLLQSLNAELDKAPAAGRTEMVRAIARDRASLTGFLVKWARENRNESIKQLAYGYAVFDAEVQRFAAVQEEDEQKRREGLERARQRFTELNDAESIAQYRATLPEKSPPELSAYDASVVMGLARTQYDLGQFKEARDNFSRLLNDRRLGPPVMIVEERGADREVDNDNYWEAVLKLIRSNLSLNEGVEESRNYLKQQLVRWGARVGGKKWKREFEQLRSEIIPDYDPNVIPTTTTEPN
jgi:tetratricopeptide (TPR) repeat protein